jgi:hypothetical protein
MLDLKKIKGIKKILLQGLSKTPAVCVTSNLDCKA